MRGSLPNFNFFNVNSQISRQNFTAQIAWIQNFTTFLTLKELLDIGIITKVSFLQVFSLKY